MAATITICAYHFNVLKPYYKPYNNATVPAKPQPTAMEKHNLSHRMKWMAQTAQATVSSIDVLKSWSKPSNRLFAFTA